MSVRVQRVGSLSLRLMKADHRSVGTPMMYLGISQAPRRVDRHTRLAERDRSTAMSTAELPMPTTSTRWPSKGAAVR